MAIQRERSGKVFYGVTITFINMAVANCENDTHSRAFHRPVIT